MALRESYRRSCHQETNSNNEFLHFNLHGLLLLGPLVAPATKSVHMKSKGYANRYVTAMPSRIAANVAKLPELSRKS